MRLEEANKPDSGWVSKHINSKLSLLLSRWLVKTPVTPNQITALSLVVGLLAAFLISQSQSYLCVASAGLLWQFFAVLDHTDGVLARVKGLQSKFGGYFDTLVGHLSYLAFFTGLNFGMLKKTGDTLYPLVGFSVMGLVLIALIPSYLWLKRSGQTSLETYNDTFGKVTEKTKNNLVFRVLNKLKYFAKGQFSRLLFCLLALMNQTLIIFWLMVVGALFISLGIFLSVGDRLRLATLESQE